MALKPDPENMFSFIALHMRQALVPKNIAQIDSAWALGR